MKFGFEGEYFLRKTEGGDFIEVPPDLPRDECGYLVECRGPAVEDVLESAYGYLCTEDKLLTKVAKLGLYLDRTTITTKLPPDFKRALARRYGKNPYPTTRFNLYGKDFPTNDKWDRAGMHIHFSNQTERKFNPCSECKAFKDTLTVGGSLNIPVIVRTLDNAFMSVIKDAHRIPGWYELKPHGFEYRSLPAQFAGFVVAAAKVIQQIPNMSW